MPNPTTHESPYPRPDDATDYRIRSLEHWRDMMEQNRLPTELALHDARLRAVEAGHARLEIIASELVKQRDQHQGFTVGTKTLITVVGGFLLLFGSFILSVLQFAGGG